MTSIFSQATRSLLRSGSFTVTVVATLALGIGLNAAIFAVVDCVLLRPLGYRDAGRIVALQSHFIDLHRTSPRMGGADYSDVAKQVHSLEATAFYQVFPDGISLAGRALYLPVANVSPRFMEVMGVQPVAGRLFNQDDVEGDDAIVGASFAREHFGTAAGALGKTIQYGKQVHAIVGVLPAAFSFPENAQVWIEKNAAPEIANRTAFNQRAIGKRRAGVTNEQLAAELAAFSAQLQRAYPEDAGKTIEAVPLQEQIVGAVRPTLRLLMGAVGVVLLIVFANIAHLQLVRATREIRAVTIRTALGASRSILAARSLAEAAILAAAGCAAAVLIAIPALQLLVRLAPQELPRLRDIHLNADVFLFSLLISFLIMAATALLPVWQSWRIDPSTALRQDAARGMQSRRAVRLRDGLVMGEVALTLTLSVAAILLTRQLIAQSREDLGFAAESLLTLDSHVVASAPLPEDPKDSTPQSVAAWKTAALPAATARLNRLNATLDSIAQVPGVLSAGAIEGAPMGFGGSDVGYAVRGRQVFAPPYTGLSHAEIRPVTPNLFAVMGIPLQHGRWFDAGDTLNAPMVLVINQALAKSVFPNDDPVGKQIVCGYSFDTTDWWTIVGVVGDIHDDSPASDPTPTLYIPVAQHPQRANDLQLVVRTETNPATMIQALRSKLAATHPEIAIKATTMRENIGETQRADNFRSLLFASFAAVSILLAAVGIYGVTSYSVAQRRFELGLRFAVGATRVQVLSMILRGALWTATAGVLLGVALSFELLRLLASVLGKLPPFDPVAYSLAGFSILLIALCASLLPARRASTIDPMTILRSE